MDYLTRMVSGYGKCEWIVARNINDILWIGNTFSGKTPHVHHCGDQHPLASHIKVVIANLLCNLMWQRVRENTVANQSSLSGFCDDTFAVGCWERKAKRKKITIDNTGEMTGLPSHLTPI
nr:exocyst complex component EXO70B1-like [Ipomoea trifida]